MCYDMMSGERTREWGEQVAGCNHHPGAHTGASDERGSRGSREQQIGSQEI